MIVIAIISNPKKLSGRLTTVFAGSPAYHIGFVDLANNRFYDMNLLFRRRLWPHYPVESVKLYRCPVELTRDDLEYWLDTDEDRYGWADYTSFLVRNVFKRLGWTITNFKGAICSEKVRQILVWKGWQTDLPEVASPTDFEKILTRC